MNLKDFLTNRDKPPELYWSLVLEDGWVQAGVWYIGTSAAEVVSTSAATPWEVEDELVGATDAALSSAVQKLPEEYPEPNKTVFGVPSSWVKNGEISETRLSIIKKICTDLSLNPVGFVVLPEAIAHLYKSVEGAPVNAIILGLGKDNLEIAVFKLGNLVGNTLVARSVSLIDDVIEGLSRFEGATPLPSRFILFNGKGGELEEAKETLIKHTWDDQEKVKFLHTPKAEILSSDQKVIATSLAGANEIGDVSTVSTQKSDDGVVTDEIPKEVENIVEPIDNVTPEDLGFSVGEDVSLNTREIKEPVSARPVEVLQERVPIVNTAPIHNKNRTSEYIQKTKNLFHSFSKKLFSGPKISGPRTKNPLMTFAVVFIIAIIGGGIWWWFVPTANIVIYVTPKVLQEETTVAFNTEGQSDMASGTLPASIVSSEVSGDKTKAATGSKLVGDKAKGTVQIQNGTAFPISLTEGTLLISSGNLKFVVDNSASVSAALSPTSPGTTSIGVTASLIGAEYNLAKSEIFKVGNYPKAEVDATSTSDFTGGSSRQISAVSKEDAETLENQLKEELSVRAKDDLESKVDEGKLLVSDLVASNVTSKSFDHKVGEEATNLKLDLTLSAEAVVADRAKLIEYARNVFKDKIPSGFVLRDDQIKFDFEYVDKTDNNINYKVKVSANFLPQTNTDDIKNNILGKTEKVTNEYLSKIGGYVRAAIALKPKLPTYIRTMPHVKGNLSVEVVADK